MGRGFLFPTGSMGAVKFPASPSLDVGAGEGLTVEGWILPTILEPNTPIAEWNSGTYWGSHFHVVVGSLYANLTGPAGEWHQLFSSAPVQTGVFQHVALTYDKASGETRLYLNGTIVADQAIGSFTPQTAFDLYLGRRPAGDFVASFEGILDEFSLYGRALASNEISAIHLARSVGKCLTNAPPPPPLHVYDLSSDFSPSSNPTGAWSYGYLATLNGPFNWLTFAKSFASENGVPISAWQLTDGLSPSVNRVMGNGIAISEGGAFTAPSGTVYVWPGNPGSPGIFGVIRFTVPAEGGGLYRIETTAKPTFDGPRSGDTDFHVLDNGHEVFGQFLTPNSGTGYSNTLSLGAGDTIDFVVGRGADGAQDHSSLKIQATLTLLTNVPSATDCVPLPVGLVAWWRAEGNGDDAAGTNSGQLLYGTTFSPGRVGRPSVSMEFVRESACRTTRLSNSQRRSRSKAGFKLLRGRRASSSSGAITGPVWILITCP